MVYAVMRACYGLYYIVVLLMLVTLVSRLVFGDAPKKGRVRYLLEGVIFAAIWPLALLSKNGRKLIRQYLPK